MTDFMFAGKQEDRVQRKKTFVKDLRKIFERLCVFVSQQCLFWRMQLEVREDPRRYAIHKTNAYLVQCKTKYGVLSFPECFRRILFFKEKEIQEFPINWECIEPPRLRK